jgi:hypothetical protein
MILDIQKGAYDPLDTTVKCWPLLKFFFWVLVKATTNQTYDSGERMKLVSPPPPLLLLHSSLFPHKIISVISPAAIKFFLANLLVKLFNHAEVKFARRRSYFCKASRSESPAPASRQSVAV